MHALHPPGTIVKARTRGVALKGRNLKIIG